MTERYSEAYDIYLDIIKVRPKNAPSRGTSDRPRLGALNDPTALIAG